MTRRERLENKLQKRLDWADKAEDRAESRFATATHIADAIPFGQPILVGHHSEGRARRDQARIWSNMDKAVEESRLAEHHASKADGLSRQLDHTIFSDDDNAIEAIEARIAKNEAAATRMVLVNKTYRKGGSAALVAAGLIPESQAAGLDAEIAKAYSWMKQPFPAYELTNLRARIRSDRERIEAIKAQHERTAKAEAAGGVTIERFQTSCMVTFAEKPDRSVINALKAAGFYWQAGRWMGAYAKLPEGIEPTTEKTI